MCALDLGFTFGGLSFGPVADTIERPGAFLVAGIAPIAAIALYAMTRSKITAHHISRRHISADSLESS